MGRKHFEALRKLHDSLDNLAKVVALKGATTLWEYGRVGIHRISATGTDFDRSDLTRDS